MKPRREKGKKGGEIKYESGSAERSVLHVGCFRWGDHFRGGVCEGREDRNATARPDRTATLGFCRCTC